MKTDGSKADLYQPTSVSAELNTAFFCDTAVGKLRMITRPSGLLVFLENLKSSWTPSVYRSRKTKKRFHPTEAIARIKEVSDFIKNCEVEIGQVAGVQSK